MIKLLAKSCYVIGLLYFKKGKFVTLLAVITLLASTWYGNLIVKYAINHWNESKVKQVYVYIFSQVYLCFFTCTQ